MSAVPYNIKLTGQRLRALRQSRGWTQAELAARAKLHVSTISAAETGKHDMTIHTLYALSRAFQCTLADLVSVPQKTP